ncbi:MAG: YciI family protein, partial [Alphaproteobacteria bacterium]
LNSPPDPREPPSPEEIQAVLEKYRAWAQRMAAEGKFEGGEKLKADGGRVLKADGGGGVSVTDGPYAEAKEVLGGFFKISAASYDEAVEIAKTCPTIAFGGSIMVRQTDEV